MIDENYLLRRKQGIGGSDIAAILGIDRFRTPLDVYLDKIGESKIEDNEEMESGRMLEDTIIRWHENRYKTYKYAPINHNLLPISHKTKDYFLATPDRLIFAPEKSIDDNDLNSLIEEAQGIAEIKNTSINIEEPFDSWICQLQWYMYILQKNYGEVVWLSQGTKLRYTKFEYNSTLVEYMIDAANNFWENNVMKKIPPEPININDIKKYYKQSIEGKLVEGNDEIFRMVLEASNLKKEISTLESELETIEESIKLFMKDAEGIIYNGELIATFKSVKPAPYFDTQAFKKRYPHLYDEFLKTKAASRRFLIKV